MEHEETLRDETRNFAFFGPTENYFIPAGGFCISVFAVVRRNGKVLLVKPKQDTRWQEWAPNWRVYEPASLTADMAKWRIPSTYVREGEAPEGGLRRVMEDQLGVAHYSASQPKLLNFYEPSRRFPGKMHWDYCFVFEVATDEQAQEKPWLAEIAFIDPSIPGPELGSAQGDILKALGSR